jgi:FKBP-type peptidyl-prolyl cis-trans isomerase
LPLVCFAGEAQGGFAFFFGRIARPDPGRVGAALRSLLSFRRSKNDRMRTVCWLFLAATMVGALPVQAQREKLSWEDREFVEKTWPKAIKTSTGLRYLVLKPGAGGDSPRQGDLVSVLYVGRLLSGKVFGEDLDPKKPFRARVGRDQLVDGWEEALKGMTRGEKRLIVVPYELGYGTRGDPPRIPRCATLVFEIELVDFGPE